VKDGIDFSQLDGFSKRLMALAEREMPQETNKFMRQEGNKLRRITSKVAKQKVKSRTKNYIKGIKRGKVYKFKGDETSIRVYNGAPHAHLIEHGHRIVGRDGTEHGFAKGQRVYEEAGRQFEKEFIEDCERFIDDLLENGLR